MVCGGVAGAVEFGVAGTPMQNISIKLLHDSNKGPERQFRHGLLNTMSMIYEKEGVVRGFYSGIVPTVMKAAINNCIRFLTYERFCTVASSLRREEETSVSTSLFAGFMAGLISALATQPIDTVKTNMQSLSASKQRRSLYGCAKEVYLNDGLAGFYRGIGARLARVCSEQAILFTLFYRFGRWLDQSLTWKE
mmetsp:Transcript_21302/g.29845  ORF Transcript_21302/g.29845 Transcript_21302/m.29845 type:complete len:193 (+) Transcript_21302:1-579(+)